MRTLTDFAGDAVGAVTGLVGRGGASSAMVDVPDPPYAEPEERGGIPIGWMVLGGAAIVGVLLATQKKKGRRA